jgi:hypothetical protein
MKKIILSIILCFSFTTSHSNTFNNLGESEEFNQQLLEKALDKAAMHTYIIDRMAYITGVSCCVSTVTLFFYLIKKYVISRQKHTLHAQQIIISDFATKAYQENQIKQNHEAIKDQLSPQQAT